MKRKKLLKSFFESLLSRYQTEESVKGRNFFDYVDGFHYKCKKNQFKLWWIINRLS